jgi:hypothetical protein
VSCRAIAASLGAESQDVGLAVRVHSTIADPVRDDAVNRASIRVARDGARQLSAAATTIQGLGDDLTELLTNTTAASGGADATPVVDIKVRRLVLEFGEIVGI